MSPLPITFAHTSLSAGTTLFISSHREQRIGVCLGSDISCNSRLMNHYECEVSFCYVNLLCARRRFCSTLVLSTECASQIRFICEITAPYHKPGIYCWLQISKLHYPVRQSSRSSKTIMTSMEAESVSTILCTSKQTRFNIGTPNYREVSQ